MAKMSAVEAAPSAPQFVSRQIPLYYQLQTILLEQITSGNWGPEHRLPSEAELGDSYGISRITVRQALAALEAEGRLRREPGRGTFVTAVAEPAWKPRQDGPLEDFGSFLKTTSVRVITVARVEACSEEAQKLQLPVGSPLIRSTCLRLNREDAYGVAVQELPYDLGRRFSKSDWKEPIGDILQRKLGIRPAETRQSIRASLAGVNAARMLNIRIGAPLLTVERLICAADGAPVARSVTHCRSDVFSVVTSQHAGGGDGWRTSPVKVQRNGSNGAAGRKAVLK